MLKVLALFGLSVLLLAACSSAAGIPTGVSQQTAQQVESSLLEDAARQATEIVAQAQATALVLQAESEAATLVAEANASSQNVTPAPASAVVEQTGSIPTPNNAQQTPLPSSSEQTVEIVQVTLALDGGMINIQFHAPPEVADKWWQGSIKVIDELTGKEYTEIPVMPKLGPLISKPRVYGQVGNVMLVNAPVGIRAGDLVTVILGNYTFEHIQVK